MVKKSRRKIIILIIQYIILEKPGLLTPTMTDVEIGDEIENDDKSEKKQDLGKFSYELIFLMSTVFCGEISYLIFIFLFFYENVPLDTD